MVPLVVAVIDEGFDLGLKIARKKLVFQQDAALQCLRPSIA